MEISALIKGMIGWKAAVDIVLIAAGLFFLYHTLLRLGTWRIVAGIMLAAFLCAVGVGLVFGLFPAMRAGRLNPVEALRYE